MRSLYGFAVGAFDIKVALLILKGQFFVRKGKVFMIGKISGSYGPEALGKAKTKKGYGAESSFDGDQASFSPFAVELARIGAELKSLPDVRPELVARLKEQVDAGEYHPSLDSVAKSLYLAGILNLED